MDGSDVDQKYDSQRIPDRLPGQGGGVVQPARPSGPAAVDVPLDGLYYEIEYAAVPFPGVGKFVLKAQKIAEPVRDEIQELFNRMRALARGYRSARSYTWLYDRRLHDEEARVFFQQAVFMKDFTDDYPEEVHFSHYFPYYQMMGYKQLRTYFTWRSRVRQGEVAATSLSYAFLYLYELLGNIGLATPREGLERLMAFWRAYRRHDDAIDRYVLRWLKDYHIYYQLPHSWDEFVKRNDLAEFYPDFTAKRDEFALFCALSKYNIVKSPFYTPATKDQIAACFTFVLARIRRDFAAAGLDFDEALFRPTRKTTLWRPFRDALFHDWLKQPNRRVIFSENEIYICKHNEWTFSTRLTSEKGRLFISYLLKRMEVVLRKLTKYKYKLSARLDLVHADTLDILTRAGLFIEQIVTEAVLEYYRDATKTVVSVDPAALTRIRQEALLTQETLTVEEPTPPPLAAQTQNVFTDDFEDVVTPVVDGWGELKALLDDNELRALAILLEDGDLKAFADACGVMLEVLVDGLNQKALDCVGDALVGEDFVLYAEYIEHVKELME